MTEYSNIADYDLQADYVDQLTDQEKLDLFRSLSDEAQLIADKEWGSDANYSEHFMVDWISTKYAESVTIPYYNNEMFCYREEDYDSLVNPSWIEMFSDYEPYDIGHLVTFYLSEDVDFSVIQEDEPSDTYSFSEDDKSISFLCPAFWMDVPLEFVVHFIMLNVHQFIGKQITAVSIDG